MSEQSHAAWGHDPRPVRTCGMCQRTGTVGFHPEPHHHDKRTGQDVFICVSRRACRSRWAKLRRQEVSRAVA